MGRFRGCYAEALRKQPGVAGTAKLRFVIARSGHVSKAEVSGLDHAPELAECIAKQAYALTFSQPEGGTVNVLYPLALKPPAAPSPVARYGYR